MTTEAKLPASVNQRTKAKQRWNGTSKNERSREMAAVVRHRWDGVTQTEEDIKQYFETAPLDGCLDTYAAMRKHYEIAGKVLDVRVQEEHNVEKCENCDKRFDKDNPWFNREPVKDPLTGIIRNIFSCSQACMIALKGRGRKPRP